MGWITAFSMAFGMFCAIPFPVKRWDERQRARMLVCFPWVGAIIGAIWAFACWLLRRIGFSGVLAGALLTALPLLLTGFIHLDGFMDCCDAIYSRRDLETRKKILKDSPAWYAPCRLPVHLCPFPRTCGPRRRFVGKTGGLLHGAHDPTAGRTRAAAGPRAVRPRLGCVAPRARPGL